jgi:hypothetical protein
MFLPLSLHYNVFIQGSTPEPDKNCLNLSLHCIANTKNNSIAKQNIDIEISNNTDFLAKSQEKFNTMCSISAFASVKSDNNNVTNPTLNIESVSETTNNNLQEFELVSSLNSSCNFKSNSEV